MTAVFALATLVLGVIIGYLITKNPIKITISLDKRDIPAEVITTIPYDNFKKIQEQQYEEFQKADNNRKDVNTAMEEEKHDISEIFQIFNGGN